MSKLQTSQPKDGNIPEFQCSGAVLFVIFLKLETRSHKIWSTGPRLFSSGDEKPVKYSHPLSFLLHGFLLHGKKKNRLAPSIKRENDEDICCEKCQTH
jgi:hypothetical protein